MVHVFNPITQQKLSDVKDQIRLLICDGHDSHISVKFVAHCIENNICLFLLLPHSSHLLQPLDVDIFSPLKTAVSADLDRLIRIGVTRLEKAEWVESYIKARPNAFTEKNIQAGWHHSGLVPSNRNKHALLRADIDHNYDDCTAQPAVLSVTTFQDLVRNSIELDAIALNSLNSKLSELAIKNQINTPVHREMPKVLSRNRQLLAENIILKRRLGEIEKIVCERKECKYGKRNVSKGKTVMSMLEVLVELEKCETETKLKKQKRGLRGRRTQAQAIQEVESSSEEDDKVGEIEVLDLIEVVHCRC